MSQEKAPINLQTPHDLSEKGRKEIATSINPLVADSFALYIKTKSFHWHVCGSHFHDHHLLFDEQAAQIFAMIDPLAERVRKLGGTTIRSPSHIQKLQSIQEDAGTFLSAEKMIEALIQDNQVFAAGVRAAHKVCGAHGDVATCSILEVFLDETERRVWFLFSAKK